MTRRRTQILELLTVRETPRRLSDLAGDLSVSDRTLRRDIAWLQAGGHDIRIERGRVKYVRLSSPGTLTASDATSRRSQIGPDKSVERASELSSAFDDLAAVQGGATRILVVSGEAGVGKTSLVTQITESASDRDFFVATGRATLDEGAPGFWPIVQLIRSLTDHPEKNGAGDLANDGNNLVSELMPVLATPGRGRLSNDGELHAIRFRLFDRVTRFVSLSAAISPVSLVIDDLQWANPATLDLVRYISSSLIREPVLIAVTVRGGEVDTGGQLRRTLAELFRHPGHRRIALSGLTREGVRRLIEIRTRQSGRPFVTDYVHALTRGNPFFIRELVEHLISRDLMDAGSIDDLNTRRVLVPESVQDILEARLRSLPDETVAVLEMASLIGTEFEIELLSQVVSEDLAGALKSALDHGAAAGLIEDQDAQIGRMAFAHPLTQVAFVERQTPTKRAAGHLGIADAMEPLGEQPSNLNDAELAHHLERAGTLAEPERLAHYAMRAGDHAMSTSAWADALRHFEVVIAALDRQDSTDSEMVIRSRARALDGAGFARLARMSTYSSQSPGFDEMNEAFELYLQLGDRGAAIALASHGWRWGWQTPLDRTKERALDLVEPGSLGYGWLISGYGFHIAYGEGEVVRASALINEALEIARENGSRQLEARALVDLMHVTWLTGDDEMSASTYRDAHRTAFDLCEDQFVAHIGLIGAIAMARVGNIDEAIRTGEETLQAVNRLGQPVFIYSQNAALRMLFRLRGDWDRMKRADEFLDLTDPGRQQQPEDYALKFQDGSKELNDVMISEARSLLEENITRNPAPPILLFTASLVAGLARLVPDDGLLDTLDRAVLEVERFAGHRWTTYRLSVLHLAAEIAYIRGTAMPRDDHGIITAATTVIDPITNISTSHARAMAYEIAGDIDRAEMAYGQALLDCRERRLRPESVWTSLDYARFLVKHRPGVSDMVLRKVVTEGSAVASALGLNPIVTRLASILTAADRQTTANHADCFGLSAREVEIASLVVGGLSNRDISKWLVITLNTVQTHVSNILAKTGVSDRTEAALLIEGIAVPPENRG